MQSVLGQILSSSYMDIAVLPTRVCVLPICIKSRLEILIGNLEISGRTIPVLKQEHFATEAFLRHVALYRSRREGGD